MTITHKPLTLPSGKPAFQVTLSSPVTIEDARLVRSLTNQGGLYSGLPELAIVDPDAETPPEFRQAIVNRDEASRRIPVAFVLKDAPPALRVAARFVAKVEGVNHRFFDEVEEAVAWLDSVA